eukprot:scaffold229065_cov33-Tisochrysis_lutea.AAC.5
MEECTRRSRAVSAARWRTRWASRSASSACYCCRCGCSRSLRTMLGYWRLEGDVSPTSTSSAVAESPATLRSSSTALPTRVSTPLSLAHSLSPSLTHPLPLPLSDGQEPRMLRRASPRRFPASRCSAVASQVYGESLRRSAHPLLTRQPPCTPVVTPVARRATSQLARDAGPALAYDDCGRHARHDPRHVAMMWEEAFMV